MKKILLLIVLSSCNNSTIVPKNKVIEIQIKIVHSDDTIEQSRVYKLK